MIAHRLDLAADDPLRITADEDEDRLRTPGQQVEDSRSELGRRAEREDQTGRRRRRLIAIERAARTVEERVPVDGRAHTDGGAWRLVVPEPWAAGDLRWERRIERGVRRRVARWPPVAGSSALVAVGRDRAGMQIVEQHADGADADPRVAGPDRAAFHPREDRVERPVRSVEGAPGQPAGLGGTAEIRLRFGSDDEGQDVVLVGLEVGDGSLAGAGRVAGPPASLGKIADSVVVEPVAPRERLELGAGETERSEAQVGMGHDQVRIAVGRHGGPRRCDAHAGSLRRRSSARRCRAGPTAASRSPSSTMSLRASSWTSAALTAATSASASSSVRTRS